MLSRTIFIANVATIVQAATVDLVVTNRCNDTIWPAINTQAGGGPKNSGFELATGKSQTLTVGTNWNGRVWGRTNCTFDASGNGNCLTGNCDGILNCTGIGTAATLAEFNLPGGLNQSYYDISLVDGYNLPLAIEVILHSNAASEPLPNTTNPSCVGSSQGFASEPFDPYTNGQVFLNTTAETPLPFESALNVGDVSNWCPSDLRIAAAQGGSTVFNPCISACGQYQEAIYCCTGKYGSAKKCHSNYYATQAKKVCPDAYSYAFDDASSTFTAPTGSGFEVIFCPGGRSTLIRKTLNPSAASIASPSQGWVWAAAALSIILALG